MDYKIIFVFVFIFILISLLRKKNENWENLQNDNYFDNFNYYDLKFRGCNDKESCKKRYSEKVLSFSPEEEIIIVKIIENFNNLINNKFRFIFNQINFIKVDNEIESTMPHTRGNNIIFAKSWVNNMINNYKLDPNDTRIPKLIAHEQFHIYQRNNPLMMADLYKNYWGMTEYKSKLPDKILKINRTNPDALPNNNWLFRINENTLALPLCVYTKSSKSLRDTQNIYIRLNNNLDFINLDEDLDNRNLLSNLDSFRDYYGNEGANNYHANELASSLFEIIIEEEISGDRTEQTPALSKLKEFLNKIENS